MCGSEFSCGFTIFPACFLLRGAFVHDEWLGIVLLLFCTVSFPIFTKHAPNRDLSGHMISVFRACRGVLTLHRNGYIYSSDRKGRRAQCSLSCVDTQMSPYCSESGIVPSLPKIHESQEFIVTGELVHLKQDTHMYNLPSKNLNVN